MSAASKLTALVVGTAGTLTVGGCCCSERWSTGSLVPGTSSGETAVIATELLEGDEPVQLAQAEEATPRRTLRCPRRKRQRLLQN